MGSIIDAINNTPVPNLLIIFGGLLLFLAFVGKFGTYVELPPARQRSAGLLGIALLLSGTVLAILPNLAFIPSPNSSSIEPEQGATPEQQKTQMGASTPEEGKGDLAESEISISGDATQPRNTQSNKIVEKGSIGLIFPEISEFGNTTNYVSTKEYDDSGVEDGALLDIIQGKNYTLYYQTFQNVCYASGAKKNAGRVENIILYVDDLDTASRLFPYMENRFGRRIEAQHFDDDNVCGEKSYSYKMPIVDNCNNNGVRWVQACKFANITFASRADGAPHLDNKVRALAQKMVRAMERRIEAMQSD